MLTEDNISVLNKTKGKLPSLPFLLIKESILGKDYSLSVAFISKMQSKKINNEYRKKNNPTNILSFPLSKKEGEILICPDVVKTETKKFDKNFRELLTFLIIHGCLHLKGLDHGKKMEKLEEKYFSNFKNLTKNK
jgi:probable rRNA maturation factor